MRTAVLPVLASLLISLPAFGQHSHPESRHIVFPDVPGYQTLVCDFHMHSVFSDGAVWPSIRVQEANRDGLDCIAITEHLEYLPHLDDIPLPDRNRAFDIATQEAQNGDLIVINGSEITRSMPPGHANAIFVEDPNRLLIDDPIEAYQEAGNQGAFIFWNHPDWTSHRKDGLARMEQMHKDFIENDLLHGIEVVNTFSYSAEALQIALDYDLTIIGTSDVHGLIDWDYNVASGGHRPVTLVFVSDRSEAGIEDALRNKRTVAWHNNFLVGRPDQLEPLVQSSIEVISASYMNDTSILHVTLRNHSDTEFILNNLGSYTFQENTDVVVVPGHHDTTLKVKTGPRLDDIELEFEVMNAVIAPKTFLKTTFQISVSGE